jgi:hypothetical protein
MGEVPVQMIKIWPGPVIPLSETEIKGSPPGFPTFATSVIEHLAVKLAQEKLCLNSVESMEHSLLQFAPMPGNTERDPLPSVPPLGAGSSGVCRITSPWVELVIERKPVPTVRAVFIYSVRQLLADQAVLAGARDVPPGAAMPLSYEELRRYAEEYALSEINSQPTEKPVEERVPPDLLWYFRHVADQSAGYNFPSSTPNNMGAAMRMRTEEYTKIVIALIDQCFESKGKDIHYNSILDVSDLFPLEQYKITTPIILVPGH